MCFAFVRYAHIPQKRSTTNVCKRSDQQKVTFISRYIRISDDTPMQYMKELLVDYWGILQPHRPHLALSLIGKRLRRISFGQVFISKIFRKETIAKIDSLF